MNYTEHVDVQWQLLLVVLASDNLGTEWESKSEGCGIFSLGSLLAVDEEKMMFRGWFSCLASMLWYCWFVLSWEIWPSWSMVRKEKSKKWFNWNVQILNGKCNMILTEIYFLEIDDDGLRGLIKNCWKEGTNWMSENLYLVTVIYNWNLLPAHCVNCNSINTFKTHIWVLLELERNETDDYVRQ